MNYHDTDKLDDYQAIFKRALHEAYVYQEIIPSKILILTDVPHEQKEALLDRYKYLFENVVPEAKWILLHEDSFTNWAEIEQQVHSINPSIIVTPRLINEPDKTFEHSLGVYVEGLTQRFNIPMLILPSSGDFKWKDNGTVMVGTEHRFINHKLINHAVLFAKQTKNLFLVHVEDQQTYNYYMDTISKIPGIKSDYAAEQILKQLVKEPQDYMNSVKEVLNNHHEDINTKVNSSFGHIVNKYREIFEEINIAMIVCECNDDTQLAMHSLGHSIAVEFKDIPILLI